MSYATIVTGVVNLLSTVTGFTASGAVRDDDYEQANAGVDKFICVVYDGFTTERNAFDGEYWVKWKLRLRLYNQITDNVAVDNEAMKADRQAVMDKLHQYPQLNGTAGVFDAWISEGAVDPEPRQLGEASFQRQWVMLIVQEDASGQELE